MSERKDSNDIAEEEEKDKLIPSIDLLSLAEERAASAPISDFGVRDALIVVYV